MAVTEIKPQDAKATEEVLMLYRYLFDINVASSHALGA